MNYTWKIQFSPDGKDYERGMRDYTNMRECYESYERLKRQYGDWCIRIVRNDGAVIIEHWGQNEA